MGIFGGEKVYVSSVVYNLAGPEKDRPNYLKTTVISNVIGQNGFSMGDTIQGAYLKGPGIKFRSFARWCESSGYSRLIGMSNGTIRAQKTIDPNQIGAYIPHEEIFDETTNQHRMAYPQAQLAHIGPADTQQFLARWLYKNQKGRTTENWEIYPKENGTWRCWHWPTQQELIIPAPEDYDPDGWYIYCDYILVQYPSVTPISSTGSPEEPNYLGLTEENFPPLDHDPEKGEWRQLNSFPPEYVGYYFIGFEQQQVWETGPNGEYRDRGDLGFYKQWNVDPWEAEVTVDVYERRFFIGIIGSELKWRVEKRWQRREWKPRESSFVEQHSSWTEDIGDGWTRHYNHVLKDPIVDTNFNWWGAEQFELVKAWSENRKFIYKKGGGIPGLDRMFSNNIDMGKFLPPIPFRLDNKMVSELGNALPQGTLAMCKKALKKAINAKYDEVEKNIKKNESLKDIDYAYVMFGVSLNVVEKACKEYLYTFFDYLRTRLPGGSHLNYQKWVEQWNEANYRMQVWRRWFQGQRDPNDDMFGSPEPPRANYPILPDFNVRIVSGEKEAWWNGQERPISADYLNYDMLVSWIGMDELTGRGTYKTGAKKGDMEIWKAGTDRFPFTYQSEDNFYTGYRDIEKVQICWQDGNSTWRILSLWGLKHRNNIYRNKAVEISAWEALDDKEESGFIVPVHPEILKQMSLVKQTQMSTANSFLVFNCYQVVKQKWYQSGLFKVFIVIIAIVINFYAPGAGYGLLGANATVGAALGFTGLAATIVGAVANALAAMLLTQMISAVSVAVFGEKLGAIIGTIASIVAIQVGTNMVNGKGFVLNMGSLFRADNLMKLSLSGIDALTKYMAADTAEILRDTQNMLENYNSTMEKIKDAWDANIGSPDNMFDPMRLTEAGLATFERQDGFLGRTLMVGSDVAEMSLAMISKFTELTLALDNQ